MDEPQPVKQGGLSANWAVREVDHLFSRLGRYTRFVIYSKWFLGLFAFALMASLIGWPLLTKDRSGMRISFVDNKSKPGDAPSPVMNNPEYRGTGEKGQQFKVNGLKATQATPQLAIIDQVEGQLLQLNGRMMSLTAARAEYHQDTKIIQLFGSVNVINDQGYNFITEHATVDTNTMNASGTDPVAGTGPMGNLLASGFEIKDNGTHIIFTGGEKQLRLTIDRTKKNK